MEGSWGRLDRGDAELWFYETAADLPVIVLAHGLAGYALEWRDVIAGLAPHFRVVAVDQRGHGSSTRRPADVSRRAYVADLLAVIDALDVDRVPIIGQSMGGHTAMLLAAQAPERIERLVMIEAGLGGPPQQDRAPVEAWLASWPAPFADREEFIAFFGGDRDVAESWADGLEDRADGLWPRWDAATLGAALAGVHEREFVAEWSEVYAPTLLVRGEHGVVPERQLETMTALRPGVEVVTVPRAGHDVHLEQPEILLRILADFLGTTAS